MRKKSNDLLKSARVKRSWTPEFVSEQIGVSRHTYMRWETGVQTPCHSSLDALCRVFALSPAELGFVHEGRGFARHALSPANIPLSETTSDGSVSPNEEQMFSSEQLTTWTSDIASCWQRYMAGEQSELEQLLPTYLTRLAKPTLYPGSEQKMAASLTSQVYQLLGMLALQRGDFVAAQTHGTQALVYSQLCKDWNVYIAAQMRLATIFSARKRIGSALISYNDALKRVNTAHEIISPILHSWIFAGLAEIQATMGREQEALQFLKLAFAVFPQEIADDPCLSYTLCDRSMLFLYEGLVFLRLGQPRYAWNALAQVDELKPTPPKRVRAEFLRYRAYTSFVLGNMIQCCIYLEAAVKAAQEIGSELAFTEVYMLYEHILAIWGQEPRVRALAQLFQK